MITLPTFLQAHRAIAPYIRRTPLIRSSYLSRLTGGDVWLKLECQQPTGSFKVRGALNKLRHLTADQKQQGIVAASAGNHALGVAHAAQSLGGIKTDIFVPKTAPRTKWEKIGRFDVTLHRIGQTYDDAHQAAAQFAEKTGALEIPAYDAEDVITGQGTMAIEILYDLPETDILIVPVGGGGMIAGVCMAAYAMSPHCRVIGVQPEASPAALLSLRDGVAYDPYDHTPTIADGLAGGFGATPFALARHLMDEILLASEYELRRAILTLVDQEQLIVEAAGAISISPLMQGKVEMKGKTAVCILSGGNLDTTLLRDILVEFTDV
jgi:threonine dehydratase